MMIVDSNTSPLIAPSPITLQSEIDVESGSDDQIQCRICLETKGRDFIAPCQCKGTSKYVHRNCLNHWRSVKEGFAFAHCTTCRARYYLRVHTAHQHWRTLKFHLFVTRDVLFIFLLVQLVIASLAYMVYAIDGSQKFWLHHKAYDFGSDLVFYYLCGSILFFAFLGLSGCFITCCDAQVRDNLDHQCDGFCLCCDPCFCDRYGICNDCGRTSYYNRPLWNDGTGCCINCCAIAPRACCCLGGDSTTDCCASAPGDCCCTGDNRDSACAGILIMAFVVLIAFAVIGIFFGVLVATVVGQRIWQRHHHILAKRMLTKEYVVEHVDGDVAGFNWCPPSLPDEHCEHLRKLDLL